MPLPGTSRIAPADRTELNGDAENAGVENAAPDRMGGKRGRNSQNIRNAYEADGGASRYSPLVHVTDLPGRRALRSAGSNRLLVPSFKLPTAGVRRSSLPGRCCSSLEQVT